MSSPTPLLLQSALLLGTGFVPGQSLEHLSTGQIGTSARVSTGKPVEERRSRGSRSRQWREK